MLIAYWLLIQNVRLTTTYNNNNKIDTLFTEDEVQCLLFFNVSQLGSVPSTKIHTPGKLVFR